ncbi:MAG: serine/threonine protein kinase, partial [Chloroflexi bacterium]|nr:serine/threonine protein kinase [Chloroflexota bacterium]
MIGTTLQGRYRIQALLGEGGMGQVYRAYDTALDREVAIKLLSPELGGQAKQRFLREARTAAKLDHPCIVTVHDVGEENGRSFIVMELAQGRTLHDLPPPTLEQTLDLATQICDALDHAHSRGIVHRDI